MKTFHALLLKHEDIYPRTSSLGCEERIAKDALRAQSIADTTKDLLTTKEKVEKDFNEMMAKQQKDFEDFVQGKIKERKALEKEVEKLEHRKKVALTPLVEREKGVQLQEEDLKRRSYELALTASNQEETARVLMRRLDDVSIREQNALNQEEKVKRMEQGSEMQRMQVAQDARRLGLRLADFQRESEEKERDFAYIQSELDARHNLILEKEKGFKEREQELERERIRLADQRFELEKAFDEIRKLNNYHG